MVTKTEFNNIALILSRMSKPAFSSRNFDLFDLQII